MDKTQIIDSLFSRRRAGIKPGLERMHLATEMLNHPEKKCKVVHIAGTNGKGSTASMLSSVLCESGYRVGLFTSPHILEFRERYILNGIPVSDDEWIEAWLEIEEVSETLELTFFEISALLAFVLFAKKECDWLVLETGLGGRLDATNVVTPEVALITSLSLEHTEYLGDTIEEITREKLGIVKKRRPFVLNPSNPSVVFGLARTRSEEMGSPMQIASYPDYLGQKGAYQELDLDGSRYELPLAGAFQQYNMATAVTALRLLGIEEPVIQRGIKKAFIPARLQKVEHNKRTYIFDVAHNPQALDILCNSLKIQYPNKSFCFIVGMMKDKELDSSMRLIDTVADEVSFFTPQIPRACPAEELSRYSTVSVKRIWQSAREAVNAETEADITVVTGSFYTVSDVMREMAITPYPDVVNPQGI